jgi:hypothetical protein
MTDRFNLSRTSTVKPCALVIEPAEESWVIVTLYSIEWFNLGE